ncbi:MAG: TorF family putative porin [Gammaproteobacteria bacterium]
MTHQSFIPLSTLFVLLIGLITPPAEAAFWNFRGDLAYTSNYVERGISRSEGEATVQGGFAIESRIGIRGGVWGSNIKIPYQGIDSQLELSVYVALGINLLELVTADAGSIRYVYSSDSNLEYTENFARVSVIGISATYVESDNYRALGAPAQWAEIGYDFPLLSRFITLGGRYGKVEAEAPVFHAVSIDQQEDLTILNSSADYSYVEVFLALNFAKTELRISHSDTDREGCLEACAAQTSASWTIFFNL